MSDKPEKSDEELRDIEVTEQTIERRLNRKKKKKAAVDTRSESEKEIDSVIEKSSVQGRTKLARKKTFKRTILASLFIPFGFLIYWGFAPFQGSMAFGICKTFLELNVPYPSTLDLSTVENFGASVRIWYTQIDSFGEYKMESVQCYYKPDETQKLPYVVEKIAVNRRMLDPKIVKDFNRSLPVLFANPPDLTMPSPLPDSLSDLKIETNLFRKSIF